MTTATTTYAKLLKEVSIAITPNDAVFLSAILQKWMVAQDMETATYLQDLVAHLNPKAGC